MIKANKHALIAERRRLVARNMRYYAAYLKLKKTGLTTLRFAEWLKND